MFHFQGQKERGRDKVDGKAKDILDVYTESIKLWGQKDLGKL